MKSNKVKTTLVAFVLAGLFGFTSSFAGDPANTCIDQLRHKLVENVKYPGFAQKEAIQGEVTIIFSLMEESICVKNIIATDQELGRYVKEVIGGIRCKDFSLLKNKEFKVKIHFSLI